MKKHKKCSLKIYDGKKMLYGAAAQSHYIKKKGGWDKYHRDLVQDMV